VRLDTANRSLLGLVGVSLVSAVWLLCSAAGCVLLALIAYDVTRDGPGALLGEDALLPAAVFLALVGLGAVAGIRSLARQAASSRRLARRMDELALPAPRELEQAAARAGLTGRVVLIDGTKPFSFAYGALAPRVAVSRGLLARTSRDELDAVLEHERYHVRNLDPLKVVLARGLPAMFFYLPVLHDLHLRYLAGRELAADRRAVDACGATTARWRALQGRPRARLAGARHRRGDRRTRATRRPHRPTRAWGRTRPRDDHRPARPANRGGGRGAHRLVRRCDCAGWRYLNRRRRDRDGREPPRCTARARVRAPGGAGRLGRLPLAVAPRSSAVRRPVVAPSSATSQVAALNRRWRRTAHGAAGSRAAAGRFTPVP
jgi:hypothetical protein